MTYEQTSVINKASKLLSNGYQTVPIANGQGGGKPLISGHLESKYDHRDVMAWRKAYPDAGLALCCGVNNVFALDFDVDDKQLVALFRRHLKKHHPGFVMRVCNPPRFAILFKAAEDLQEISNAHSVVYKTDEGKRNQIEMLGRRTITLYGNHRESEKPYRWPSAYSPMRIKADDLPTLTKSDIEKIFKIFAENKPHVWTVVGKSSFRKPRSSTTFEEVTLTRRYTDEEVIQILKKANGDGRQDWIEVGMALHAQYDGQKKGLILWNKWSKKQENYKGIEDLRKEWRTFKSDGGITINTINKKLGRVIKTVKKQEGEWDGIDVRDLPGEEKLQYALDNWYMIERAKEVADITKPVEESTWERMAMSHSYSNQFVPVEDANGEVMAKPMQLFKAWEHHPERKSLLDYWFVPCYERILSNKQTGRGDLQGLYYNTYVPPHFNETEDNDLVHHFVDHVKFIFDEDWEMAMNWFAQILQQPEKRHRVALHSVSLKQGTGRGLLVTLFNKIYGHNVNTVNSLDEMFSKDGKNGYLHNSVMVVVNEMTVKNQDQDAYGLMSKLKTVISDDIQAVNLKYGKQTFNARVYTRLFCQSNSLSDLKIDFEDTRFLVTLNIHPPKPKDYYRRLASYIEGSNERADDFYDQVFTYLMNWELREDWLQTAPMTTAKKKVIQSTMTPTEAAFNEFKTIVKDRLFNQAMVQKYVSHHVDPGDNTFDSSTPHTMVNKRQLNALLLNSVVTTEHVVINGSRKTILSFDNIDVTSMDKRSIIHRMKSTSKLVNKKIKLIN